jgi:hypothetical protein
MNESTIREAKNRAEVYLSLSIAALCDIFEFDYNEIITSYELPPMKSGEDIKSYDSLKFMVNKLKELRLQ